MKRAAPGTNETTPKAGGPPELSILCTSGAIDMSATDGAESAICAKSGQEPSDIR